MCFTNENKKFLIRQTLELTGGDSDEQPDQHHGQQDVHRHPQGNASLHHAKGRGE